MKPWETITLDEFIKWMESKGSKGELATRAFKYWRNKYCEEISKSGVYINKDILDDLE